MGFFNELQNRISPYSNEIIRTYLNKMDEEMNSDSKKHPWMRADILTSNLYSITVDGKKILLEDMIFGDESVNTKKNIIVVMGERHIGKTYFVNKLLEVCKKSVDDEKGNIEKEKKRGEYRIPIVIPYKWYEENEQSDNIEDLIAKVIEEKCISVNCDEKRRFLKDGIKKLLAEGRFIVYFEGEGWLDEIDAKLKNILGRGKITEDYNERAKYRNLVILAANYELEIKDSFLNENNYIELKLNKLEKNEVIEYLKKYIPELIEVVGNNPNIMNMMRYPEHLEMLEDLNGKNLLEEETHIHLESDFEFYDYFIRANIRKKLENKEKTGRENAIYDFLCKYAEQLYLSEKVDKNNRPSRFFGFEDYRNIGILNEKGEFVFPVCGYYLAAKYLVSELKEKKTSSIIKCLLEGEVEDILVFVSRMIGYDIELFSLFWQSICGNTSCKLLLLAKVVKETSLQDTFIGKFCEKAFYSLGEDFYDYTVLEAFGILGSKGIQSLKREYLELGCYNDKNRNNIKKRIVYFLGISHSGIIMRMLDELMEEDTDLHLKYHIIRAAVENYDRDEESRRFIENKMEALKRYCGVSKDPIIVSDFSVLYQKYCGKEWLEGQRAFEQEIKLQKLMEDDAYWIRAHAAGAIGRKNTKDAYILLEDLINRELQFIYGRKEGYRNSIKVISYSVEAICELSEIRTEEKDGIVSCLTEMIDIERLGDEDIEDAYSTIATGIEYILNPDIDKLPFNLGGRFRNHTINYVKVLLNMFQKLFDYEKGNEGTEEKIEKLKERISKPIKEEKKNIIKILQLTDWHFESRNSDNIRSIKEVKNLKDVDILIITGDLRQYGKDYKDTLEILREIVSNLGIEPKDVFMVPGNHDSDEFADKEIIIKKIREGIFQEEICNQEYMDKLKEGFQNYESFLNDFYGESLMEQGGVKNKLLLWDNKLNILCMNTSLMCDSNSEMPKIVNIDELSEITYENKLPVVAISHHNLEQLYLEHASTVKAAFKELQVSCLISGDLHRSQIKHIDINPYVIPNYICGKFLGQTNDRWSRRNIAIYTVDLEKREIVPSLYMWKDDKYEPDVTFDKAPKYMEDKWEERPTGLLLECEFKGGNE